MSDAKDLIEYYKTELTCLRRMGTEFARNYPKVAGRLELVDEQSTDPHVERLIESFAFLAARIQYNIESDFPLIPSALLEILYPHFLSPVPSMTVAEFEVDPSRFSYTTRHRIEKNTYLFTRAGGEEYRFGTCYPVDLWPIAISKAEFQSTNRYDFLDKIPEVSTVLKLRIKSLTDSLADLNFDSLRFYLNGEFALVNYLYELLFCNVHSVAILPENSKMPIFLPKDSIRPVGFGENENILPFPSNVPPGYRLLYEYFNFYEKFYFFDIDHLAFFKLTEASMLAMAEDGVPENVLSKLNVINGTEYSCKAVFEREVEMLIGSDLADQHIDAMFKHADRSSDNRYLDILIMLDRMPEKQLSIGPETFRLGCAPIVNLFNKTTDPIRIDGRQSDYILLPDKRREKATEIYSIVSVSVSSESTDEELVVPPFFSFKHQETKNSVHGAYWFSKRREIERKDLPGTQVSLSFTDIDFNPAGPPFDTIYAKTVCTNRSMAELIPMGTVLQIEKSAPLVKISTLFKPTPQVAPPMRGKTLWRLISHLSLNYLSLGNDERNLHALKEILRLYNLSDRAGIANQIDNIKSMSCGSKVSRIGPDAWRGFCRGIEINLEFKKQYMGSGAFLLASVLNRFFPLYASINTFTQLVIRDTERKGIWKKWEPMIGEQIVL